MLHHHCRSLEPSNKSPTLITTIGAYSVPSSQNPMLGTLGFNKPIDWKPPTTSQSVSDTILPGADVQPSSGEGPVCSRPVE
jgi:hypothetical protein